MIEGMAVVHRSEADVVKDIAAVLAKVRQGLIAAFLDPTSSSSEHIASCTPISALIFRGSRNRSRSQVDEFYCQGAAKWLRDTGPATYRLGNLSVLQ